MKNTGSLWYRTVLSIVLWMGLCFCPSGEIHCAVDDNSGKSGFILSIPGKSADEGEEILARCPYGEYPDTSMVSRIQKAVIKNRAYTFVGIDQRCDNGASCWWNSGLSSLLYYWNQGAAGMSGSEAVNQHTESMEKTILYDELTRNSLHTFATCVFKEKLYLFFACETGDDARNDLDYQKIYYMTGEPANDGSLKFEGEADLTQALKKKHVCNEDPARVDRQIAFAKVMNEKIYVFFSKCMNKYGEKPWKYQWFCRYSEDGVNWQTLSLGEYDTFLQSAAVFRVKNPADHSKPYSERMMLGYTAFTEREPGHGTPKVMFFDGQSLYGDRALPGSTNNVLLSYGTVNGATDDTEPIQVWHTGAVESDAGSILHAEYIPAGPGGDQGSFVERPNGGIWTELTIEGASPWMEKGPLVHGALHDWDYSAFWRSDRTILPWDVTHVFTYKEPKQGMVEEVQQYLDLTFFQKYTPPEDYRPRYPLIKTFRYKSDVLKASVENQPDPVDGSDKKWKDFWIPMGVIEGPPPFALNGHTVGDAGRNISVTIKAENESEDSEVISSSESTLSTLHTGFFGSFSIGEEFKRKRNITNTYKSKWSETLTGASSHDRGYIGYAFPRIQNTIYSVYSYNEKFIGPKINVISMPDWTVTFKGYNLTAPEDPITSSYSHGIRARWKSTDYMDWYRGQSISYQAGTPYQAHSAPQALGGEGRQSTSLSAKTTALTQEQKIERSSEMDSTMLSDLGIDLDIGTAEQEAQTAEWSYTTKLTDKMTFKWDYELAQPVCGTCKQNGNCVSGLSLTPYVLVANSPNVDFSPEFFRQNKALPWCVTYKVRSTDPYSAPLQCSTADSERLDPAAADSLAYLDVSVPWGGGGVGSKVLNPGGQLVEEEQVFETASNATIDLTAYPKLGYSFLKWEFSGEDLIHDNAKKRSTWVSFERPGAAASVSAVFGQIPPKFYISVKDGSPKQSYIEISKVYLDESMLDFNPDADRLTVSMGRFKLSCTPGNGKWWKKDSGYFYNGQDSLLYMDLEEGTLYLYSTHEDIFKSVPSKQGDYGFELAVNGKGVTKNSQAQVSYSFTGKHLDPPIKEDKENLFEMLSARGSLDGSKPEETSFTARGVISKLNEVNPERFKASGIVVFYFADRLLFKAKVSEFTQKGNLYTCQVAKGKRTSKLTIDAVKGEWAFSSKGDGAVTFPQDVTTAALVVYDASHSDEPGWDAGLGEDNARIMWYGGDVVLMKRQAKVQAFP